ncbi:MAG: ATP-binding protein [Gammaproteobacteria bacterium]
MQRGEMMLGIVSLVVDNMRLHEAQQRRIQDLSEVNQRLSEQQQELIKAHRERAASEARLTSILDIAPAGIIVVDEAGLMSVFNKGAETIFGYAASDALGQCYEMLLPDRLREIHRKYVADFAVSEQTVKWLRSRREIFGKRKDGSEFPAAASISKMTLDGRLLYTVVLADMTEQKRAEEALRKEKEEQELLVKKLQDAQSQLLQSEKMASIGQLAAGVAHEINNPVGYVNSNLSTLKQYVADLFRLLNGYQQVEEALAAAEHFRQVSEIKEQIELDYLREDLQDLLRESQDGVMRVRQIVQDLKDFSHVDEAEWQWADIHAGLDSTLNIVHNELKYKAEVIKEYAGLPQVECIISQLNQVFMNLLVNAAQAIEEHGTITVRSGCDGEGVWVEIEDSGKGMDEATQQRIFDPFFTTKPVGKGTGLGLSLSYNIIKKHQGRISVASEEGKGTTFHIWLPVRQAQQRAAS